MVHDHLVNAVWGSNRYLLCDLDSIQKDTVWEK
jgi:hypothetical protein